MFIGFLATLIFICVALFKDVIIQDSKPLDVKEDWDANKWLNGDYNKKDI